MMSVPKTCDRDGEILTYQFEYTAESWSAKVRDSNGDILGTPQITSPDLPLTGKDIEEMVEDWVLGCIRDRVGVR
jgi:hypothetical protein